MAEKIKIKFNKSYDLLLEQAGIFHGHLTNDIGLFNAEFPKIDAQFLTDFGNAITAADNTPSDEEVVNDQQVKTLTVNQIMATSRKRMQRLFTYADLAFPDNPLSKEIFGNQLYQNNAYNQLKMIEILELAHKKAEDADYKQALIDEGFIQARIDELNTLRVGLRDANLEQEGHKTGRPVITQTRVINMNTVWGFMVKLNKASKVVFEDDYAKQQQYLLYPELDNGGNNPDPNTAMIGGSVKNINTNSGIANSLVELRQNGIVIYSANTDENGLYQISGIVPGSYEISYSADGFVGHSLPDFELAAGDDIIENVQLTPILANISGTMSDINTDDPISNGRVIAYEDGDPAKYIETFTDESGNFNLGLPVTQSTNVILEATANSHLQEQQSLTIEPGNDYPNRDFNMTPEV